MADDIAERVDSLSISTDCKESEESDLKEVERGIAKVRFSDEDTAISSVTCGQADRDESISEQSSESSDVSISHSSSTGEPFLSSLQKAATVSACADSDILDEPPPSHLFDKRSFSSPEVLETTGYRSEVERMLATHMDVTHVLDRLYLSDFISLTAKRLTDLGITLVVNATREIPNLEVPGVDIEYMKLDVLDTPTANLTQHMDACADRIHEVRSAGGAALVHCAFGISRSVSICLAYLVKYEGRTLREAYFEIKKKRPIIRPNEGFWRQLIAFETAKRGHATVKLSVFPMGAIPDVYRGAPKSTGRRYVRNPGL